MGGDENTLKKRLQSLLDEKKWTDIKFSVGRKPNVMVLEAHKNIMSAASDVFAAMCYGGLAENNEVIPIPDITPEAFSGMLQYIYTDSISLTSVETTCDVMYAAEKYMLYNLTSKCTEFLLTNIFPNNVLYVLEYCSTSGLGYTEIIQKCMKDVPLILSRPEFIHSSKATVNLILDQESLYISSEAVLLDACVRWGEEQCIKDGLVPNPENLKTALGPVVRKIRFQSMTAQELVGSTGFHKLLTHEEAYKILANVIKPGTFPLTADFCACVKKRTKEDGLLKSDSISVTANPTSLPLSSFGLSSVPISLATPSYVFQR